MKFTQPIFIFFSFWILLLLIPFYVWTIRRKKIAMERFASPILVPKITPHFDFKGMFLKPAAFFIAIFLCFVAIARPQWGFEWHEVKNLGLDIIVAVDTSKSMLAEDMKPNRLERTKLALKDFVNRLKGDRIGLIAFSGTAFLQCPLTIDYSGFLLSIDDLNIGTIPKGGTSIAAAIDKALEGYDSGQQKNKFLIIITDGEDHEGGVAESAQKAYKQGVRIFCIGVGTERGEFLYVAGEKGKKILLEDKFGKPVISKLNEDILKRIAAICNGAYVHVTATDFGLELIYDTKLANIEKRETKSKMEKKYIERFQIFLTIALALLLLREFVKEKVDKKQI